MIYAKERLKAAAEARVAQYPQYKGHFDMYILVCIKRKVKSKSGLAFEKDELAIAKPLAELSTNGKFYYTVWSHRNGVDTSVRDKDVELIG
jgi:hypothetical protein